MSTQLRITNAQGVTRTVTIDGQGTVNVAPGEKVEMVSGSVTGTKTSGGALVMQTAGGQTITLKGFVAAAGSANPPSLVVPGQVAVKVENPDGSVRVKVLSAGEALGASSSAKLTVLGAGSGVSVSQQGGEFVLSDATGTAFNLGNAGQMTPPPSSALSNLASLSSTLSTVATAPTLSTLTWADQKGVALTTVTSEFLSAPTQTFIPTAPPPPTNVGAAVALNAINLVPPTNQQTTSESGTAVVPGVVTPGTGTTPSTDSPTTETPTTDTPATPGVEVPTTPVTPVVTTPGGTPTSNDEPAAVSIAISGFLIDGVLSKQSTSATGTIVGTASAGMRIQVFAGATLLGSTTADASGNWSFTPTAPLPAGFLRISANGFIGTTFAGGTFLSTIIDVPTPMPLVDGFTTANRISPFTYTAKPTLTGSGIPGGRIEVKVDDVVVGTTTITEEGRWSLPLTTALTTGTHVVTAIATGSGASGFVSQTSLPTVVKVDLAGAMSVPTAITGLTPETDTGAVTTDGLTTISRPTVTGTGAPNSTMRIMIGGAIAGETPVGSDGKWVYTFKEQLVTGANKVTAIAVDPTGVAEATATAPFTVTLAGPLVQPDTGFNTEVSYPTASSTKLVASGVLKNASAVSVLVDGQIVPVTYTTTTTTTSTLAGPITETSTSWRAELVANMHAGAHKEVVTYTDAVGNTTETVATVHTSQNVIRPTVSGLTAASDKGLSSSDNVVGNINGTFVAPVLTGHGQPGDKISILFNGQRGGDTIVGADGVWTYTTGSGQLARNNTPTSVQAVSSRSPVSDASAAVIIRDGSYDERNHGSTPGRITKIGRFTEMEAQNYSPVVPGSDSQYVDDSPALPMSPRPTLRGTAIPNSMVRIFVQDERTNQTLYVDGEVGVDADGNWAYNLQKELPIGKEVEITARYFNPALHGPTEYDPAGYFGAFPVMATRTGLLEQDINTYTGADGDVVATNMFDLTRTSQGQGDWQSSLKQYPEAVFVFSKQKDSEKFYQTGKNTITITFGIPGVDVIDGGFNGARLPPRGSATVKSDGSWVYDNEAYSTGIYTFLLVSAPERSVREKLEAIFTKNGIEDFNKKFWTNFFSEKPAVKIYDDLGNYVKGTVDSCSTVTSVTGNAIDNVLAYKECEAALKQGYDKIKEMNTLVRGPGSGISKIAGGGKTLATIWLQNTFDLTMSDIDADFKRNNPTGLATRGLVIEHKDFTGSHAEFTLAADGKSFRVDINAAHPAEMWGQAIRMHAQAEIFMDGKLVAKRDAGTPVELERSEHVIDVLPGTAHTFQVALTDLAGNRIWLPAETIITGGTSFDGTKAYAGNLAAATPIVAPFVTGLSAADLTNSAVSIATPNTRPTIQGTGVPGASIQIKIDGDLPAGAQSQRIVYKDQASGAQVRADLVPMVTVGADGKWSYTVPAALGNGAHTIETTAFIKHPGNHDIYRVSPKSTSTIQIDRTDYSRPTVDALTGPDVVMGQSAVMRPPVQGSAPADVVRVDLYVDGVLDSSIHGVTGGQWTAQVARPLSDGLHQITAIGYANSGKATHASAPLAISVSAQAVKAPVLAPMETNSPSPTIKGTADAWTTVTVYIDGVEAGQAQGGNWQIAMPKTLADGHHIVTAVATDRFGKKSPLTAPVSLDIDTALLGPVPFALLPEHDTSLAHTGWLTRHDRPVLTGTAKADSTVTVMIDGQVAGQASVNGQGKWSFVAPQLPDGTHFVSVTATDRAGNVTAPSEIRGLTIDTAKPAAPGYFGMVELANGEGWALQGTATPGSLVTVKLGNVVLGEFMTNAAGRWSADLEAKPALGASVQLTATSPAGVKGATTTVNAPAIADGVTLALSGDALAGPGIADGFTNVASPTLTGRATPGKPVEIYLDGVKAATVTADAAGLYTHTLTSALADGPHAFRAASEGGSSSTIVLTLDTGAPVVTVLGLVGGTDSGASGNDDITIVTTPIIGGTSEPGATVTVLMDGQVLGTATAGFTGFWSYPLTAAIAAGTHSFTATAVDRAGNTGSSLAGVSIVDGVVPAPPVVTGLSAATDSGDSPTDGLTNQARPTVVGSAAPGAVVTVFVAGVAAGTTQADAEGAWSLPLATALANGTFALTAHAADLAGNLGTASDAKAITIKAGALPAMTIDSVTTDPATLTTNVSGTAPAGETVQLNVDGQAFGTTMVHVDGSWTLTLPETVLPKDHALTAMAVDAAGNAGPLTGWKFNPPTVGGVTPETDTGIAGDGGTTSNTQPTLTGTGPASSLLQISVDNVVLGIATSDATGQWSLPLTTPLTPGTHTIKAGTLNGAGEVVASSADTTLTIETSTVTPVITTDSRLHFNGAFESRTTSGTSAPNAAIVMKFDGVIIGQTVANDAGQWSIAVTEPFVPTTGSHYLWVEATSPGGLKAVSATASASFGSFSASISGVVDGPLTPTLATGTRPVFRGSASGVVNIQVFVDGVQYGGTAQPNNRHIWEVSGSEALTPGAHTVKLVATSAAVGVPSQVVSETTYTVTVDGTVPAAPALAWPFVGPAVSASPDGHPTITGSAQPGAFVVVYLDGQAIGNATAEADGTFSMTPGAPIAAGSHTLTTRQFLPTGGVSALSEPVPFIVSTSLATPTITGTDPQPLLAPADGSLLVPTDSPALLGTATPGATVRVYVDGRSLGLAIADGQGQWRYPMPIKLAEGDHDVSITAYDKAGNESAPVTKALVVDVDALAADVTGVSGQAGAGGPQWAMTGTAEPNAKVLITVDGVAVGSTRASAAGAWVYDVSAHVGDTPHAILATVVNASGASNPVGNVRTVEASNKVVVTGLSTATDSGASATDDLTRDTTPVLEGVALPGAVVQIVIDGVTVGTTTTNSDGAWAYAVVAAIAEGAHTIKAIATDIAGNIAITPVTATIKVDLTGPVGPTVTDLAIIDGAQVIRGTTEPGATVEVFVAGLSVGTTTADETGAWSRPLATPIAAAPTAVTAQATDTAANLGALSTEVELSTRPTALGVDPATDSGTLTTDGLTNVASPVLRGTGVAGATVQVFIDGVAQGPAAVSATGTWSFTPAAPLAHAAHTVAAAPVDGGVVGTPTTAVPFTVDRVGPSLTTTLASNLDPASTDTLLITDKRIVTFTGTAEPGSILTFDRTDGTPVSHGFKQLVDASGTWSFTTEQLNRANENVVESYIMKATDPAGNVTATPFDIDFRLSVQAPTLVGYHHTSYDPLVGFQGKADPDDTVSLTLGDRAAVILETDENGDWHYTPTVPFTSGRHAVVVQATDAFGKKSEVVSTHLDVDLTPTVITPITSLTDGVSIGQSFEIRVDNVQTGNIHIVIRRPDGSVAYDQTQPPGFTGQLKASADLQSQNGDYIFEATVYDANGVARPTGTFTMNGQHVFHTTTTIVVDEGAMRDPFSPLTADSTPVIKGQAANVAMAAGATVKVAVQGGATYTGIVNPDGSWEVPVTEALADGAHSLNVSFVSRFGQTDSTGGATGFHQAFEVATAYAHAAPTLMVDSYAPYPATTGSSVPAGSDAVIHWGGQTGVLGATLSGSAYWPNGERQGDTLIFTVDGVETGPAIALDAFNTRLWPDMTDGRHEVRLVAIDQVGNRSQPSAALIVEKDSVAPTTTVEVMASTFDSGTDQTDGVTNVRDITFTGKTKPHATVEIITDRSSGGMATADADGNWSYRDTGLGHGTHTIKARATSLARVTGTYSTDYSYTVDLQAPDAPVFLEATPHEHGLVGIATPTLHGTAEKGSVVTLKSGDTVLAELPIDADGHWSYLVTTPLTEGQHTFTATTMDAAGNVAPTSYTLGNGQVMQGVFLGSSGNLQPSYATTTVTVDLTAPGAALAVGLGIGSDTGADTDDGHTQLPTVTISGSAEAWATIAVLVDGQVVGTAQTTDLTLWSLPGVPLGAQGAHSITTVVTDRFGRVGGTSAPVVVTLDSEAPVAPSAPTLQVGSDTGLDLTDRLTNIDKPTLEGTAEAHALVSILVDGQVKGTTQAGASGAWSHTLTSALTAGAHSLTTTATDAAGNQSAASGALALTLDTSGPAAVVTGLAQATGTSGNTALAGTAKAGSAVVVNVASQTLPTVTADDGTWSVPLPFLPAGPQVFTVTVTDRAGTTAVVTSTQTFTGSGAPVITGGGNTAASNDRDAELTGTAPANTVVHLFDGATPIGTVTPVNGHWTYTATHLTHGAHSFTAVAENAAGYTSGTSAAISYSVDIVAPDVPTVSGLLDPTASLAFGFMNAVQGTAEPGSQVSVVVDGGAAIVVEAAPGTGAWSAPIDSSTLAVGPHTVVATARDAAGNLSPSTSGAGFTVAAPDAPTIADAGSVTPLGQYTSVTLTGTAPTVGAGQTTVTLYDHDVVVGTTTTHAGINGAWSYTATLTHGSHAFTATASDEAGHVSTKSTARVITTDLMGPAEPTVTGFQDPLVMGVANVLEGTAEPNSTVVVNYGNSTFGPLVVSAEGAWSVSVPGSANYRGSKVVTAQATDAVGNLGALHTATPIVVPDPDAPTIDGPSVVAATTNRQPTMTGKAYPGSLVFLVNHDNPSSDYGYAHADGNGNWSITVAAPLGHGATTFNLSVAVPGILERATAASPVVYNVDIQGPGASTIEVTDPTAFGVIENSVHGTAEVGSTVVVQLDSRPPETFVIGPSGTWSIPVASASLAAGTHTVTTTIQDALGNVGAPHSHSFTVSAPAQPVITSGGSTVVTKQTSTTLTGTATEGTTVKLYDGATEVGSVVAGAGGSWSVSLTNLAEGPHSFTARATDPANRTSVASEAVSYPVDSIAPLNTTIDALTTSPTPVVKPTLTGTAEPGSTVTLYDGATVVGTTTAAPVTGAWSHQLATALVDGPHTFTARATDTAQNTSTASAAVPYLVDATQPGQPTLTTSSQSSDNLPTISGTAEAGSTVTIFLNGSEYTTVTAQAGNTFSYTFTTAIPDGLNNTIHVTATDAAGNTSVQSGSIGFGIDTTPPADTRFTFVAHGSEMPIVGGSSHIEIDRPTFIGIAEANSTIRIYHNNVLFGETVTNQESVDSNGNPTGTFIFKPTSALPDGSYTLEVEAEDAFGNVSNRVGSTFVVRTPDTAPNNIGLKTDPYTVEGSNQTSTPRPTLMGTASPRGIVSVYVDGVKQGEATADEFGEWTFPTTTALSAAHHVVTATVTVGTATSAFSDTYAMEVVGDVPPAPTHVLIEGLAGSPFTGTPPSFTDTKLTLSGRSVPGAIISLFDTHNGIVSVYDGIVTQSDGTWSYTFTEPLQSGQHQMQSSARNDFGKSQGVDMTFFYITPVPGTTPDAPVFNPLDAASDTGALDGVTAANYPTFSGTAQPGATVEVFETYNQNRTTSYGSAVADVNGNWSFTSSVITPDYLHTFVATARVGDYISYNSDAREIIVDTLAPTTTFSDFQLAGPGVIDLGANAPYLPNVVYAYDDDGKPRHYTVVAGTTNANGRYFLDANGNNLVDGDEELVVGDTFTTAETSTLKYEAANNVGDTLMLTVADTLGHTAAPAAIRADNAAPMTAFVPFVVNVGGDAALTPANLNVTDDSSALARITFTITEVTNDQGFFYLDYNGDGAYNPSHYDGQLGAGNNFSGEQLASGKIRYSDTGDGSGDTLTVIASDTAGNASAAATLSPQGAAAYRVDVAAMALPWWDQPGIDVSHLATLPEQPAAVDHAAVPAPVPALALEQALMARVLGVETPHESSVWEPAIESTVPQAADFGMINDSDPANAYLELLQLAHAGQG